MGSRTYLPNTEPTSGAGLVDSAELLVPCCGAGVHIPFSKPGEAVSGEPELCDTEALLPMRGMEMLGEGGGCADRLPEGRGGRRWALPWLPEKMRLSLLLRVSLGRSLERRRPPVLGEPKGVGTAVLEPRWALSWHHGLVEVTSMYFISLEREREEECR